MMKRKRRGFFDMKWSDLGLMALVILALLAIQVCTNTPTEPPSETCEPPDNPPNGRCGWNTESCSWDCPEPPPPPPPPPPTTGAVPGDYVHVDRVDGIINGTSSQNPALLHGMVWAGWRDPVALADRCSFACNGTQGLYFGKTCDELRDFGAFGLVLLREGENQIIPNLEKDNRRCNPNHRLYDPAFLKGSGQCERAEIRRSRLMEYRGTDERPRLRAHKETMNRMRARAQTCATRLRANGGKSFDSITGWCAAMKLANFRLGDCP